MAIDAINPQVLYEIGSLQEVLASAYQPFLKATKQAEKHGTPEDQRCAYLSAHGDGWAKGSDVIAWLETVSGRELKAKNDKAKAEAAKAAEDAAEASKPKPFKAEHAEPVRSHHAKDR